MTMTITTQIIMCIYFIFVVIILLFWYRDRRNLRKHYEDLFEKESNDFIKDVNLRYDQAVIEMKQFNAISHEMHRATYEIRIDRLNFKIYCLENNIIKATQEDYDRFKNKNKPDQSGDTSGSYVHMKMSEFIDMIKKKSSGEEPKDSEQKID